MKLILAQPLLWLWLVGSILLPIVAVRSLRDHRKKSAARLTVQLRNRKRELTKEESFWIEIKYWFSQVYFPSWASFGIITFFAALLVTIGHLPSDMVKMSQITQADQNGLQSNLVAIHAGIGTIIFALIIFVAESLRDDEGKDRARVLLRESFLFPLTIAEVLVFFGFLRGDINWLILVPIALVGLAAIWSLSRLLAVLLNKYKFNKKRLELLKERIKRSIGLAINQRLGNAVLMEKLGEEKIELAYLPAGILDDDNERYFYFSTTQTGTVTDIHFDVLTELAQELEEMGNKKGLSFYENKAMPTPLNDQSASPDVAGVPISQKKYTHDRTRYILRKYKDPIEEEDKRIFAVSKALMEKSEDRDKISDLAKRVFEIKKTDESFSEEIIAELDGLKDQFLTAIGEGQLGKVKEMIAIYLALAETFLELLNKYGGGYDYKQAKKELSSLWDEWSEMRWLHEGVREAVIKAVESGNGEVLRDVAYLPIMIANRAIKNKDHYLFQKFINFPALLYHLSQEGDKKENIKKFLIERSHIHLKEMTDYFIESRFKDSKNADDIKQYKGFAIAVFSVFLSLLRDAYGKRDLESFKAFAGALGSLYRHFRPEEENPNAEHLRFMAESGPEDQREETRKKLELQVLKENAAKEISEKKQELFFGLGGWMLKKLQENQSDPKIKDFYDFIQTYLPNEIEKLTSVFIGVHDFRTADAWGWDSWDLVADGEVHSIDVNGGVERLYAVKALQLLKNKTPEALNAINLPHNRDIAYLAEESSDFGKLLKNIENNSLGWAFVLSPEEIAKVPDLKALFRKAKEAQEADEARMLANAPIKPEKIEEFYKKFLEAFSRRTTLRQVFKHKGMIDDRSHTTEVDTAISLMGYNQIDDKAAFIETWHVHFSGWGENYGDGVASGEDREIFQAISDGLTDQVTAQQAELLDKITEKMVGKDPTKFVALGFSDAHFEYGEPRFVHRYRRDREKDEYEDMNSYMGYLKLDNGNLPFMRVFAREPQLRSTVCVVAISEFATWHQLPPFENIDNQRYQRDIFAFSVFDLNASENDILRNEIIAKKPTWLNQYPDQDFYLRQRVVVRIYEKFKLEILDPSAGFKVLLANQSNLEE